MSKQGMHGILGHAMSLCLEIEMQAMDAELASRIAQALANQPAQRRYLRDTVTLHDVAKQHAIHIRLQQWHPQRRIQPLRLREPSLAQILAKTLFDQRPRGRCPARRLDIRFLTTMAQKFTKTERPDDGLHAAPTQGGVHLARQHACRRTGHDNLDLLGIQQTSHQAVPARHQLDFVEKPMHLFLAAQLGIAPVVFLDQQGQLLRVHVGQTIIVKAQIDRPLRGQGLPCLRLQLAKKGRLARTAHADHRMYLAGYRRQTRIAPCHGRGGHG